jgi:hypothetical protein
MASVKDDLQASMVAGVGRSGLLHTKTVAIGFGRTAAGVPVGHPLAQRIAKLDS